MVWLRRLAWIAVGWAAAHAVGLGAFLVAMDGAGALTDPPGLRDVLEILLGLVAPLTSPVFLLAVLMAEGTRERRAAYYAVLGAVATFAPVFLFVGFGPWIVLRLIVAGGLGGLAYWAVAGRTAGTASPATGA